MTTHTLDSIAKLAGVSRGTVSNIINNKPGVNPEVRERVLRIISETNYQPNSQARILAGGKTQCIGIVVFGDNPILLSHRIFTGILQGIQSRLTRNMYDMLLFANYSDASHDYWKRIGDTRKIDGLIIMGSKIREEYLMYYHDKHIPFVLIGKRYFQHVPMFCISSNYRQGAYLATKHLLGQGRKRIVFLRGFSGTFHEGEKLAGYRQALKESSLEIDLELVVDGGGTQKSAKAVISGLEGSGIAYDGVFSVNDLMAFGAIEAIQEQGGSVPRDVSVVGYDDIEPCSYFTPKLSTVRQDLPKLGEEAADLLLRLIAKDQDSDQVYDIFVENELVIRESSVPGQT